jgi:hypothetical protein
LTSTDWATTARTPRLGESGDGSPPHARKAGEITHRAVVARSRYPEKRWSDCNSLCTGSIGRPGMRLLSRGTEPAGWRSSVAATLPTIFGSGTLVFRPGDMSATLNVRICFDAFAEGIESYRRPNGRVNVRSTFDGAGFNGPNPLTPSSSCETPGQTDDHGHAKHVRGSDPLLAGPPDIDVTARLPRRAAQRRPAADRALRWTPVSFGARVNQRPCFTSAVRPRVASCLPSNRCGRGRYRCGRLRPRGEAQRL